MSAEARKVRAAWLSVVSNTVLVVSKLTVGLLIGSVSVISEAIHSAVDLLAALVALFAVKAAEKPPDAGHPFGHGKVENISGTFEALLIFGAAGWIIYEAVHKLWHPGPVLAVGWGVVVMLLSAVVNLFVSRLLFRVGRETDSIALQADAWHLRTDVWTSCGVMAGLAVIWGGERLWPGVELRWIDPVAAIAVALLILHAAWRLTRRSLDDLLDASLPEAEVVWVRGYLAGLVPRVCGYHRLRTRRAGATRFIQCHVVVDPEMTVAESHRITEEVGEAIRERLGTSVVTIHIEPCDGRCVPHCLEGCLRSEEERGERRRVAGGSEDPRQGSDPRTY